MDVWVSIGQVKRDISELVDRVACGKERIILTSRGKPKAVIINLEDYDRLNRLAAGDNLDEWQTWLAENGALNKAILNRRQGQAPNTNELWDALRSELEANDDYLFGE